MGCGGSTRRVAPLDPNWLPPELPMLLTQLEQDDVWTVWREEVHDGGSRADALLACADVICCPAQEVQVFSNIVDPSFLSYIQACQILGVILRGDMDTRARLMFDAVDLDKNGSLDPAELEVVLRQCAPPGVYDEVFFKTAVKDILDIADTDGDRLIDFEEWKIAMPMVSGRLAKLGAEARARRRAERLGSPRANARASSYRRAGASTVSEKGAAKSRQMSVQLRRQSLAVSAVKADPEQPALEEAPPGSPPVRRASAAGLLPLRRPSGELPDSGRISPRNLPRGDSMRRDSMRRDSSMRRVSMRQDGLAPRQGSFHGAPAEQGTLKQDVIASVGSFRKENKATALARKMSMSSVTGASSQPMRRQSVGKFPGLQKAASMHRAPSSAPPAPTSPRSPTSVRSPTSSQSPDSAPARKASVRLIT
eukprot:TRINITY_DN24304_c0_g1_i1.p1 TRINITY_DN24304_c0_g1~~TRINITY_DN24304_c0_g1_i1.p1  ORF type:complete len:453 (+),score=138.11 TRINITY_DN24304_c0_g1_i1:91-1359(+)